MTDTPAGDIISLTSGEGGSAPAVAVDAVDAVDANGAIDASGTPQSAPHPHGVSRGVPKSSAAYRVLVVSAFVMLSAAWIAMLHLLRSQGIIIIGDEPHYPVEAVSIGRFHTLDMNRGYNFALTHHIIYPWTGQPGPHLAASIGQAIWRHHLYLPFHAIGLSALLALPMLAGTNQAVLALIIVLAALTVGLAHLTAEVSGVRSPWRIAIAGLFLAPAFALAATHVYSDLITDLLIAIIVMTIPMIEVYRRCTWMQLLVVALVLVALPWMDQKNTFSPVPLLVAFLIVCLRAMLPRKGLRVVIIPSLASLAALMLLNL